MIEKKNLILIVDTHANDLSLDECFESKKNVVNLFSKESEIIHFLKINRNKDGVILLDPRLPFDFLDVNSREIKNQHLGEVGYIFIKNITDLLGNFKIIFYTTLSKYELLSVGFPKSILHYQKPFCPIELGKKIEEIC